MINMKENTLSKPQLTGIPARVPSEWGEDSDLQDFSWNRESSQCELALGGSRASGFLVRLILWNIPQPCLLCATGEPLIGPFGVSSWKRSAWSASGLQFTERFHLPYLVYSTARKAFCIICISRMGKYASQMNKNHESKEIGTFYLIEFLKCEK